MFSKKYSTTLQINNLKRVMVMLFCDVFIIIAAALMAAMLKGNDFIYDPISFYAGKYRELILLIFVMISSMGLAGSYTTSWRYAEYSSYVYMYMASCSATVLTYALSRILVLKELKFAFSDYLLIGLISTFGFTIERFMGRYLRIYMRRKELKRENAKKTRVMDIGAGDTGSALIRSMRKDTMMYPVVAIDDDAKKHGMVISDVPIIGGREKIPVAVQEYKIQEIIIAIPSGNTPEHNAIMRICKETGIKTSTVPSLFELVSGKASISQIREVTPQDLLGRTEEIIEGKDIFGYIEGKTIMVTGGGGSIGSELCRQIARFNPNKLIIFDIYENNAYDLQQELRKKYPELRLEVLIGSVRDRKRLEEVFETYKPKVVFHAAAHKHVPLMEDSPDEAIKNNVYGTYNVASTCEKFGVERFVLISTDKAVNPTNIMGTSKRIAEMVMQRFALSQKKNGGKTIYAAVRFGNVLGSNGSVIPLFKKQIAEGGPVTVTHPEINRFFMTIPEASQLVMQAGALAEGGEIFILDMGEPVKIVDLARNLIELSGLVPDVDIKIEFSGLRPGEKMYEEILLDKEKHAATKHDKIFIEQPINDSDRLIKEIFDLREGLSCEIPLYDGMIEWFKNEIVTK